MGGQCAEEGAPRGFCQEYDDCFKKAKSSCGTKDFRCAWVDTPKEDKFLRNGYCESVELTGCIAIEDEADCSFSTGGCKWDPWRKLCWDGCWESTTDCKIA